MDISVDEAALRRIGVELLVVFGSAARGRRGPMSDVDVGVLFRTTPGDDFWGRLDGVYAAVEADGPVDVVVLNTADPLLLNEVARDGKPLFEARPGGFEEFRIYAVKRYFDTAWMRRIERAALRNHLA